MLLFLTSQASTVLDLLLPKLSKPANELMVAFIPTAADPYPEAPWVDVDRKKLIELEFTVYDVDLKGKTQQKLRKELAKADIIFVAGGNTFYLLEQSQKSGFADIVKELVADGIVYIGSSAGSVLVGPSIKSVNVFDDATIARLTSYSGLELVDFIVLPHYNAAEKEKYEHVMQKFKDFHFIPLTNRQAIMVTDQGYTTVQV